MDDISSDAVYDAAYSDPKTFALDGEVIYEATDRGIYEAGDEIVIKFRPITDPIYLYRIVQQVDQPPIDSIYFYRIDQLKEYLVRHHPGAGKMDGFPIKIEYYGFNTHENVDIFSVSIQKVVGFFSFEIEKIAEETEK